MKSNYKAHFVVEVIYWPGRKLQLDVPLNKYILCVKFHRSNVRSYLLRETGKKSANRFINEYTKTTDSRVI
jgi:hypothetical protein